MNVVIYARFSSHNQNEQSIEGQLKTCYEFAKRNNYTVINEYIDRAISGTTDNRPQFQRMIEDSSRKHFQGVLVYQLDRFARNRYDSATYKAKLKKNGVRVYSARENITDDASGILVEGLLESMAEYYSAELSQKIRRGMDINAEKCLCTGGNVALGFKVDKDKHFIIDETTAPTVRKIFEMYASGKTITEIINYLNEHQITTSRGGIFNKNSLRTILKNKRYIGIYTYKDKEIKDGMPRIIDDNLFYKVAERLKINKKAPAKSKADVEYILTTKLFCGHCKEMFVGVSGTSRTNSQKHYYYYCKGHRMKNCNKKNIRKEYIENWVVDECRKQLTQENIDLIAREVVAYCEKDKNNSEVRKLKTLLKNNERKRNNLTAAIIECDNELVRKTLYEQIPVLENEKSKIEKEISCIEMNYIAISLSEIKFFLSQLKNGNINDFKYRKMLVTVLVNKIYLYDDNNGLKMSLILNTSSSPTEITCSDLEEIETYNKQMEKFVFKECCSTIPKGKFRYNVYFM